MLNIIFINEQVYRDTLVGKELLHLLDKSVLLNSNWGCFTDDNNEVTLNIALDNMVYNINNFLHSKKFDNIIIGWKASDFTLINKLITHLDSKDAQITIFNLTDNSVYSVDNFELLNKEYYKNYYTIESTGQLVKLSYVDTTDCSAFKSAHILSKIIQ
ncbi:MAG: hypothetical protein ACOX1F_07165 [Erysipelotrichaceae bacterium]|jgi:hypothetical protein